MPLSQDQIAEMERQVLSWFCQETAGRGCSPAAAASLLRYRWREPLHQVIFEVLMSLSPTGAESINALVTERLTRRGFPDVAWEELFQPHGLSESDAEKLIENLLE